MAAADIVKTEWGYYCTGGTDATSVWTDGRKYVRTVVFIPNGAADTMLLTSTKNVTGTATNWMELGSSGTANHQECPWHLDDGVPADNMKITLSDAAGAAYIVLR
jgi:hypothetical protein